MYHLSNLITQSIFILFKAKQSAYLMLTVLIFASGFVHAKQPNWALSGTFLDSDNARAMFVDENGDELLVELGDTIQGCDLVDVFIDLAKLRCKGKEYTLQLRSSVGDLLLQAAFEEAQENSATVILSKSEISEYINDKQKLVSEISFLPVIEDEQIVGFTLSKIQPDTKAASLGLYNGDIVKVVNGVSAADPDFMQSLEALSDIPEVSIEIDRDGQLMAYTYILD